MEAEGKPPFDPQLFLARAAREGTTRQYDEKQVVFQQGEPADAIFYVQEGWVRVATVPKSGKELTITIVGAGGFLGEECLTEQKVRLATVITMTKCSMARLDKASALALLKEEAAFGGLFSQLYQHDRNADDGGAGLPRGQVRPGPSAPKGPAGPGGENES
jgi:CRP-like cAMP-binding protein